LFKKWLVKTEIKRNEKMSKISNIVKELNERTYNILQKYRLIRFFEIKKKAKNINWAMRAQCNCT